jgi:DMSO/TMAO reductase YedYZ molybdopterin-dependent catalytic subunit
MVSLPTRTESRLPLPTLKEATFALLAGITGVVGSYAVAGYTRQFVVAPIDDLVVRLTPGSIVTWMIENVGDEGHLLHIALSMVIAAGIFGAIALGGIAVARRLDRPVPGIGLAGVLTWAVTAGITGEPMLAVGAAAPVTVFTAIGSTPSVAEPDASRRRVLAAGASAVGFAGLGIGAGKTLSRGGVDVSDSTVPGAEGPVNTGGDDGSDGGTGGDDGSDGGNGGDDGGNGGESDGPAEGSVQYRFGQAEQRELDVASDDVPGLVSSIGEFYNVDIAEFEPEVPQDDWSLTFTGEIDSELTITFDELVEQPVENRFVSLRCVGEDLNGRKLDNAVWTGTPIAPLLEEIDPQGECNCVMVKGEDGYYVQYPVSVLKTGFLAWGMNGQPLPQAHGHPVRILIPGHWGETNVKWLNKMELLNVEEDGYWEERGWEGTGEVKTVAKLWGDTVLDDGRIEVAGHAYAGTRGIQSVEVSIDGGETWTDAELSDPLPADDVWRQWRYAFEPDGSHDVVVRAIDGEGNLQIEEDSSSSPSGATGWVEKTVSA